MWEKRKVTAPIVICCSVRKGKIAEVAVKEREGRGDLVAPGDGN